MGEGHEEPGEFTVKKKVDESWKDSIRENTIKGDTPGASEPGGGFPTEPGFSELISSLGMQALAALGEIAHPLTHETTPDLFQAKYLIDTLEMLSEKTKGNLTQEEELMIKELLYALHMKFVQKSEATA